MAVADVDALVKRGTPLDEHAKANTTSIYTEAIFPTPPRSLSTDLTSLSQTRTDLAITVEMEVDREGRVTASAVYRAFR